MFYRTDIFEELGIEPPETWEDLYRIIPVLQRNNMEIGLPYQQMDGQNLIDAGMDYQAVKGKGQQRTEGKEYVVNDGDIIEFLFNV